MKQTTTLLIGLLCFCTSLRGQNSRYPNGFTYKVLGIDTYSSYMEELYTLDQQTFGFCATYNRYLNPNLSLSFPFRLGTMNYPYDFRSFHNDWTFYAQDVALKYNFSIKEAKKIQPYMMVGLGFMNIPKAEKTWETQLPVELGLDIELLDGVFLEVSTSYRIASGANAWHNGIGIQFLFDTKKETAIISNTVTSITRSIAPESQIHSSSVFNSDHFTTLLDDHHFSISEVADDDKDGVPNVVDKCPNEFGEEGASGCPPYDDDQDGLANYEDRCPLEVGLIEYGGCPDTDGDDIPDIFDACPNDVGSRSCKGCPDTDGDKVPNRLDKCPTEPGRADNEGCPLISESEVISMKGIKPIYFEANSYVLDTKNLENLNAIVDLMKQYPTAVLSISGFAYDGDDEKYNDDLSLKRAKNCFEYLIQKGISEQRITYQGFGNTRNIKSEKLQKSADFQLFM